MNKFSDLKQRTITGFIGLSLLAIILPSQTATTVLIGLIFFYIVFFEWFNLSQHFSKLAQFFWALIFLIMPAIALISLNELPDRRYGLLMIFLVFVHDSAAYFAGKLWGTTKIAPKISPNKSIQGCLAGFLISFILIALLLPLPNSYAFIFALIFSVLATTGDLLESYLKRRAHKKDSGNILPGHGGFLDRFDAIFLVAPFWYALYPTVNQAQKIQTIASFNAASAYNYVKKQVEFGPRIPNTQAHQAAASFFVQQFKKFGAQVTEQNFQALTYDHQNLNLTNIIASFNLHVPKRILLAAHWDTRPYADKDKINPRATFDGANDGASGVAVLLEIARVFSLNKIKDIGLDIILFDGEDWGEDQNSPHAKNIHYPAGYESWWCLGSQYWSQNKHLANYSAQYGIVLDMVGGKNSKFAKEFISMNYAENIVNDVWLHAKRLDLENIFVPNIFRSITDDHLFINKYALIPTILIIAYDDVHFFGDYHHTQKDNLDIIDEHMLKKVGTVVLHQVLVT
jgi:glutaminyl-peptide cyclotransferase